MPRTLRRRMTVDHPVAPPGGDEDTGHGPPPAAACRRACTAPGPGRSRWHRQPHDRRVLRRDAAHRQELQLARQHRTQRLHTAASTARPGTASARRPNGQRQTASRWAWRRRHAGPCRLGGADRRPSTACGMTINRPPAAATSSTCAALITVPAPTRRARRSASPAGDAAASGCGQFNGTSSIGSLPAPAPSPMGKRLVRSVGPPAGWQSAAGPAGAHASFSAWRRPAPGDPTGRPAAASSMWIVAAWPKAGPSAQVAGAQRRLTHQLQRGGHRPIGVGSALRSSSPDQQADSSQGGCARQPALSSTSARREQQRRGGSRRAATAATPPQAASDSHPPPGCASRPGSNAPSAWHRARRSCRWKATMRPSCRTPIYCACPASAAASRRPGRPVASAPTICDPPRITSGALAAAAPGDVQASRPRQACEPQPAAAGIGQRVDVAPAPALRCRPCRWPATALAGSPPASRRRCRRSAARRNRLRAACRILIAGVSLRTAATSAAGWRAAYGG